MTEFSTNKYIHNIEIKHLHGTNKTVFIKNFSDKQIELKIIRKMLSKIDLIHLTQPDLSRANAKKWMPYRS